MQGIGYFFRIREDNFKIDSEFPGISQRLGDLEARMIFFDITLIRVVSG
jgi:hypothetical protein